MRKIGALEAIVSKKLVFSDVRNIRTATNEDKPKVAIKLSLKSFCSIWKIKFKLVGTDGIDRFALCA
jgi:hypothetical protein